MPKPFNCNQPEQLYDHLRRGGLVLTPNNRLADAILKQYLAQQPNQTCIKPQCMPWSQWLKSRYQQLTLNMRQPVLLSDGAVRLLWKKLLIEHSPWPVSHGFLQQIMNAYEVCSQWSVDSCHEALNRNAQTRFFQQLWIEVESVLKEKNAITAQQLPHLIAEEEGEAMIWACFDDYSPMQVYLQKCFSEQGFEQHYFDWPEQQTAISYQLAEGDRDELNAALYWLSQQPTNDGQRYALVVPDLQDCATQVLRQVENHLTADMYDISLGKNLFQFPLVAHACVFLQAVHVDDWRAHAKTWLYSPFLQSSRQEQTARWKELERLRYEPQQLNERLSTSCPILHQQLQTLSTYPKRAALSEWRKYFYQRLQTLGFPGDAALDSTNWQVLRRFYQVLDELSYLDVVTQEVDLVEAIDILTQTVKTTIFQAKQDEAPIQISGVLEASGLPFDGIWLMHAHDQLLPAKVKLNPFIPSDLQQKLAMPHSSPEREYQLAEGWLERFQACTQQLIVSHSSLSGDSPRLPSPLLAGLTAIKPELPLAHVPVDTIHVEEQWHLPLKSGSTMRGGSYLLADQAKCPFKAFTAHRLLPKRLDSDDPGISPIAKGTILHRCMEYIWKHLQSWQVLMNQNETELTELIDAAVIHVLDGFQKESALPKQHPLMNVEKTRISRLVASALEWEKGRQPFVVTAIEQRHHIKLSDLEINIQVDRMDTLHDGQKWVLDYKSTIQPSNQPWNEERPLEPQLLLYALLDEDIQAMAWVQLKSGHVMAKGYSEGPEPTLNSKGITDDDSWINKRQAWQQRLEVLADEVIQGLCTPTPAKADVCTYCQFSSFCRIGTISS